MLTASLKPKPCAHCKASFMPQRAMQAVCSPICARRKVDADKKAEKTRDKERATALETIPKLTKAAQKAFNAAMRMRDAHLPCITCGKMPQDQYQGGRDCGHWRSTGSASHLRFTEDNVAAQCVDCNRWGAGMAVEFRIGLIQRIGLERVEALEQNNTPHKWTKEELRGIKATYVARLKQLQKDRE